MAKKRKKIVKKITIEPKKIEEGRIKRIKIRVIGIGGGGGNIISEIAQRVKGASFCAANTDFKALKNLPRKVERFLFGQILTKGLGTGMHPEIGREAAKDEREKIKKLVEGQDLIILIASLGGGVGSGATPIFAKTSKNLGNLTYGIFTLPFKFEGEKKMEIARNGLRELRRNLNTFSIIPNERIFQLIERTTPLKKSLSAINKSLADSLQSLIEIIYTPGLINIDFADFKTILEGRGRLAYLNSIEIEKIETKEAIERVINSPLYPYGIEGAKGILLNITGQRDLSLAQVSQISKAINEKAFKESKIIFGVSQVKKAPRIKITILATGCSKKIFSEKPGKKLRRKIRPKLKKRKIKSKKLKIKISPKIIFPPEIKEEKKKEVKIRKNALQIKKEEEEEEAEMLAKEKFWEPPAFLRRRPTHRPPTEAVP